jgi:hypothetical protein
VAEEENPLKVVGWSIAIACVLGLMIRSCDQERIPDYGCIEEVTPWGVECA